MNGRGVGDSEKPASETAPATHASVPSPPLNPETPKPAVTMGGDPPYPPARPAQPVPCAAPADPAADCAPEPTPTPESGARNRRSADRIDVMWSVDCETEETFLYAAITNISAMGIFVRTTEPLPVGTRVTLRFAPPHAGPQTPAGDDFVLTGIVQWVNPLRPHEDNPNPGMGIRFSSLTPPDRERIVETIRTIAYLREEPPEAARSIN